MRPQHGARRQPVAAHFGDLGRGDAGLGADGEGRGQGVEVCEDESAEGGGEGGWHFLWGVSVVVVR